VGVRGREYVPVSPPSSSSSQTTVVTTVRGMVPARSTGTRTPPVSTPPPRSVASGALYKRGEREQDERVMEQREREREREYMRESVE